MSFCALTEWEDTRTGRSAVCMWHVNLVIKHELQDKCVLWVIVEERFSRVTNRGISVAQEGYKLWNKIQRIKLYRAAGVIDSPVQCRNSLAYFWNTRYTKIFPRHVVLRRWANNYPYQLTSGLRVSVAESTNFICASVGLDAPLLRLRVLTHSRLDRRWWWISVLHRCSFSPHCYKLEPLGARVPSTSRIHKVMKSTVAVTKSPTTSLKKLRAQNWVKTIKN